MIAHEKYLVELLKVDAEHLKDTLVELGQSKCGARFKGTINNICNSIDGLCYEINPNYYEINPNYKK